MKLPQRCLLLATALSLMLLTVLPNAVWAQEVPPNAEDEVQTPVGERTVELIELTGTLPVDLTELTVDSPPLFGQYAKLAAVLREQYPAARTFADVKTKRVIAFKEGLPELKILQDSDCGRRNSRPSSSPCWWPGPSPAMTCRAMSSTGTARRV
jgi:hypothetical protein